MSRTPTVSIGLPVRNGENFLAETLKALLEQTYEDFELIVTDNESTDATADIVRSFEATDPRVRYVRNGRDVGANRNFNKSFALARGRYFKWAAHDDLCRPTYLERCVERLDAQPDVVLCHTGTVLVDRTGEPLIPLAHGFLDRDGVVEGPMEPPEFIECARSPRPHDRFAAVVHHTRYVFHIFGVGRADAYRRTMLQSDLYGADKLFLAQLALVGRFEQVDEDLWLRRCHPQTSTRISDRGQLSQWSSLGAGAGFYPMEMLRGYLAAIARADLPAHERRACYGVLARKVASPAKWRQLVLPGPWNYLNQIRRPRSAS